MDAKRRLEQQGWKNYVEYEIVREYGSGFDPGQGKSDACDDESDRVGKTNASGDHCDKYRHDKQA
jgi:hypothetical protein